MHRRRSPRLSCPRPGGCSALTRRSRLATRSPGPTPPWCALLLNLRHVVGIDRSETGVEDPARPRERNRSIGGSGASHTAARRSSRSHTPDERNALQSLKGEVRYPTGPANGDPAVDSDSLPGDVGRLCRGQVDNSLRTSSTTPNLPSGMAARSSSDCPPAAVVVAIAPAAMMFMRIRSAAYSAETVRARAADTGTTPANDQRPSTHHPHPLTLSAAKTWVVRRACQRSPTQGIRRSRLPPSIGARQRPDVCRDDCARQCRLIRGARDGQTDR